MPSPSEPSKPFPIPRMSASPSRRVHFAEEVGYSPRTLTLPPLSPSPRRSSESTRSTPPTPGPITPPQHLHNFNALPLPEPNPLDEPVKVVPAVQEDQEIETLHPILLPSRTPQIRWNLHDHVSTALACLTPEERNASVITPGTRKLRVISTTLPWYMSVRPSPSPSPRHDDDYVTVEDLLKEVAASLSVTVVDSEMDGKEWKRTAPAFEARCRAWRLDPRRSRRARVDFLEDRTVFAGFVLEAPGLLRLKVMSP